MLNTFPNYYFSIKNCVDSPIQTDFNDYRRNNFDFKRINIREKTYAVSETGFTWQEIVILCWLEKYHSDLLPTHFKSFDETLKATEENLRISSIEMWRLSQTVYIQSLIVLCSVRRLLAYNYKPACVWHVRPHNAVAARSL